MSKEEIRTEVVEDWNKVLSHNDILQILNQHFSGFARNIKIENMSFNTYRNQLSIHLEGKETSSINTKCGKHAVGEEISLSDLKEIKSILEERLNKKYRYMAADYEEYCKREILYRQDVNYERLKRVNKRIEDFVNTI